MPLFYAAESDSGQTPILNDFRNKEIVNRRQRAIGSKRIENALTFKQRLAAEAMQFKEAAEKERPGTMARELLLRRARQAETASHINEWLNSPGLASPK